MPIDISRHRSSIGTYNQKVRSNQIKSNQTETIASSSLFNNLPEISAFTDHMRAIYNSQTSIQRYRGNKNNTQNVFHQSIRFLAFLGHIRIENSEMNTGYDKVALLSADPHQFSGYKMADEMNHQGSKEITDSVNNKISERLPRSDIHPYGAYRTFAENIATLASQGIQLIDEAIVHYDPLSFPGAAAASLPFSDSTTTSPADLSHSIYELQDEKINRMIFMALTGENSDVIFANKMMESVIFLMPQNKYIDSPADKIHQRYPRVAENHVRRQKERDHRQYIETHCNIRTKTNQGNVLGDGLLVSAEYVRNPLKGIAEKIKGQALPGHQLTSAQQKIVEIANMSYDIFLGIFTIGAYPIIKYAVAKGLKTLGQAANGDKNCLQHEFSAEELANLLFDTEVGMTDRKAFADYPKIKPKEFQAVKAFVPDGLFTQEARASGINTVKYITIEHDGVIFYIKEKKPGEYWAFHPYAVKPDHFEKRVYFDEKNNKINFEHDIPNGQGLDYEVKDGKSFINLYGQNYELAYNWDKKSTEVVLKKENGDTLIVPVYMELLSKRWHMLTHNNKSVFTPKQKKLINKLSVKKDANFNYRPEKNNHHQAYGDAILYCVERTNDNGNYAKYRVVEMSGELLPVRIKVTPKHGLHYEAYDLKREKRKGYPLAWDGDRWVFEAPTSAHISRQLKKSVQPDWYVKNIDASQLSAPDERGLQWDKNDSTFLKIKRNYINVAKLNGNRFRVKTQDLNSRVYLVYKKGHFFIESPRDRINNILTVGLNGRKRKHAIDVLKEVDGFNEASAQALLNQYQFPENSFYDDYNFALELEQTLTLPAWAKRFKNIPEPAVNPLHPLSHSTPVDTITVFGLDSLNNPKQLNLGEQLGEGAFGSVHVDFDDPSYVIKHYIDNHFIGETTRESLLETMHKECESFNRYYGEGASEMYTTHNGDYYLRMYRIPGKVLEDVPLNSLPADAVQRYVDMLEKLTQIGIIHNDLHIGNVLWDEQAKIFYPIDISNIKDEFFANNASEKEHLNYINEYEWEQIVSEIEKRIIQNPSET